MGKISSFFSTLALNPRKYRAIKAGLKNEVVVLDIVALLFFSWSVKPLTKMVYYKLLHKHDYFKRDYDTSMFAVISNLASQISKIASLVYLIDVFDIILTGVSYVVMFISVVRFIDVDYLDRWGLNLLSSMNWVEWPQRYFIL